jgi:hypothetical protein
MWQAEDPDMIRRLKLLAFAFAMLGAWSSPSRADLPANVSDAMAWYDTLGFPDTKDLQFVRVATGLWGQSGSNPPENRFAEGFLVSEEADAFTVFICSVSDFKDQFGMDEPYAPLTTVRFVRKDAGPAYEHVGYEVLGFDKASTAAMDRVRAQAAKTSMDGGLIWGRPVSQRARIFAFARACLQKGLSETASALMMFAANIPDEQTGKADPRTLRETLQTQIGHAVLVKTEQDWRNPSISWVEQLKVYGSFAARYPASPKVAYAQEAADALKKMIAEEATHHPKPLEKMTPAEQVAENIYQLRFLGDGYWLMWIMNSHYPIDARTRDGKEVITPVHRLVDLGQAAVPQLIEALGDRRFTRLMEMHMNGLAEPRVLRVGDVAQNILGHMSGRNFYPVRTDDGKLVRGTTRQQAEAWWAEIQSKGEKQVLIKRTASGSGGGLMAARKLAEKYPDAAIEAIEAGIRATKEEGYRGEYVEVAGSIPGEAAEAFLKSKLGPGSGLYSQVYAADALFARGKTDAVPAMIEAWRAVQPRLATDEDDAYSEVGGLIEFLAESGDARAIDALGRDLRKAPVDVRLAVVEVYLPFAKHGGGSSIGKGVSVMRGLPKDTPNLPDKETSDAVERLLVSALDDAERRFGMERDFSNFSLVDPRVCDMAAYVLSTLWPDKYRFRWATTSPECDAQIAGMRNRWRANHGLPTIPPPPPAVIPEAKESEVDPWLDRFSAASDDAGRDAVTAQIAKAFGLGGLPAVRARFEESKNAAFRGLAINLASRVREVRIEADAGGSAEKSGIASLQGQSLAGGRLYKFAYELEAALPADVRSVTFFAERAGDGTGFKITIQWLSGEVKKQNGWDRQMAVRGGNRRLYDTNGYASKDGIPKAEIYRGMGDAFEKAIQSEIDAPVVARCRIERSP